MTENDLQLHTLSNESDLDSEIDDETKKAHLSERGKRMADSVAEFILMRYFFGHVDRKKQIAIKQSFMSDMQFCLPRGYCTKTTTRLNNGRFLVS